MIQIKGVTKKYGDTAIFSDLNFTFESKCIYGLVGKNGAGKTTLLNIISNYDRKYIGDIIIDDKQMNTTDFLNMPIAYAMEQPSFFNELTIYENLLLIASGKKLKKQVAIDRIDILMELLELKRYQTYSPVELSKGTLQRFNNACAIIRGEKITLFDEPFSGLDPVQIKLLEHTIIEFHGILGGIYIISSHDIESLQNICGNCTLLHNGVIKELDMAQVDRNEITQLLASGD